MSLDVAAQDNGEKKSDTLQRHPTPAETQLPLFQHDGGPSRRRPEVRGDDHGYLRSTRPPATPPGSESIRVVDLFAGAGGLSLGVREAAAQLGMDFRAAWAADSDEAALRCYEANFPVDKLSSTPLEEHLSFDLGSSLTAAERSLADQAGSVDMLLGGPPCQGHSDLNNSTRRDDPKNALYMLMGRAAEVFRPKHVVIENVVGAQHDKGRVVQRTQAHLEKLGYHTSLGVIDMAMIGVPQTRKRLILLGSQEKRVAIARIEARFRTAPRDLRWAIQDLGGKAIKNGHIADEPSTPSGDNQERIEFLFENDLYDLPDEQRPACHREKRHSYKSIYGRLHWDEPAQTITRGFYSTCMGRYVHPEEKRTITAHEAARLQFFPDWFDLEPAGNRTALARIIGNAVPMKLSFAVAYELLSTDGEGR